MTQKNRILFGGVIMFMLLAGGVMATPNSTWNHRANPSLLSAGGRPFFELGVSGTAGVQNSYLSAGRILQQTIVLDLDELNRNVGNAGYRIGSTLDLGTHFSAHLFGLGVGIYADNYNLVETRIPKGFFEVLAEGIEMDKQYASSSQSFIKSYIDYGVYSSLRWNQYTFGGKLGIYIPLAHSRNAEFGYEFLAKSGGELSGSAGLTAELYSAFDLENSDTIGPEALEAANKGLKIDFGVIHNPNKRRPDWGLSVINVPLYAPPANYGWNFTADTSAEIESLLDLFLNEDSDVDPDAEEGGGFQEPELDFGALDGELPRIYMPLSVGGFYRYTGLPLIDLIGHGALVFSEPFRVNAGVHVEGSVWPLTGISFGIAHQDIAWRSTLGLRLNIRVLELGLQVSTSSPQFWGVFSTRGAAARLNIAMGF
ncbi:hypothetical protein [Spirochaeta dissipatitropha]